ncbi:MAG TPA: Gfo/Idh/MocA family oxidoreductase [Planctomycetota bacterium]|nr:Gfo/Idh/MocA family oxidoreductase [Planctomycetota bacterium]HRR79698.1 Gfo/Idh/MocA family oxidoreductase [Planctomycetota bacterium]HRT95913.1 Gfo/Idh/MocA family oxidoreductase [Planctomycetota bacterium]
MGVTGPVGFAFVGCGNIAGPYADSMQKHPDRLAIVGAYDLNTEAARAFASKYACKLYASLDELIADPQVEAGLNLTVHLAHPEVTQRLLRGGKHVHSEKPLAATREDGQACVQLAAQQGLLLSCSPFVILGEAQQTLKKVVQEGLVGDVKEVYAEMNWSRIEAWHPAPAAFYGRGAGPLFDVGCYPLSVLIQVFGSATAVRAMGGIRLRERTIASGPDAGKSFTVTNPDHTCTLIEFDSGIHCRLTASFFAVKSAQAGIEVHGTDGSLRLDSVVGFNSRLDLCKPGEREWRSLPLLGNPYPGVEWARGPLDLAAGIRKGKPLTCPGDAAYHVLDITLAALEASGSGTTVPVRSRFRPTP